MNSSIVSRRSFLGGIAAITAAAALSPSMALAEESDGMQQESLPSPDETLEYDVVVIGSGMAGMSAALTASDAGARVLVLESLGSLGGNTNLAEGMFAVGSAMQQEMGITDIDVESILEIEYDFQNYNVDTKWWETVARNSAENIDWLMGKGVVFDTVTSTGEGIPKTWHIFEGDHGASAIAYLQAAAEQAGVDIMTSTPATAIISDGMAVSGVQATNSDGVVYEISAGSVIIACGGCSANIQMMEDYTNRDIDRAFLRNMPGENGFGIQSVADITGERPKNITVCQIGLTIPETDIFSQLSACMSMEPTQMIVNQDGERFVTEQVMNFYSKCGNAVQNQKAAYSICDQSILDHYMNDGCAVGFGMFVKPGTQCTEIPADLEAYADSPYLFVAETIVELAEKMGVDPDALAATVEQYNAFCSAGNDGDYGKDPAYLMPIENGPFYAAHVVPNILNTMGGVRINHDCQVVNSKFEPVVNLYCAGMDASGFQGETYGISISGSCQGVAICTGRIAGQQAAENALA